jgi:hypothetical protein
MRERTFRVAAASLFQNCMKSAFSSMTCSFIRAAVAAVRRSLRMIDAPEGRYNRRSKNESQRWTPAKR